MVYDFLVEDAEVTAIALPSIAANLGYTLQLDGDLYTAANAEGEVIGQYTNEEEAVATILDYAIAEANAIDFAAPMSDEELTSLAMLTEAF